MQAIKRVSITIVFHFANASRISASSGRNNRTIGDRPRFPVGIIKQGQPHNKNISNRQLLRRDSQRHGNLFACSFSHRFFGFLLGVGALRDAKAVRNFCLGEAKVFAPGAYGCHVLVDDFVDHGVGDGGGILFGQAQVFRVGNHGKSGFAFCIFQYLDVSRCVHSVSPLA